MKPYGSKSADRNAIRCKTVDAKGSRERAAARNAVRVDINATIEPVYGWDDSDFSFYCDEDCMGCMSIDWDADWPVVPHVGTRLAKPESEGA